MASELGNKGNKRKAEESAKGNANKHLICPDNGSSTSSETKQKEQGEGNVRRTNWMKFCEVDDSGANPQCSICKEYYLFYIDSTTLKKHLSKIHKLNIEEEKESSNWIFRYYNPIIDAQNIKCYMCERILEVPKFEGPFVEHFDETHDKIAKRINQGSNENAEEVESLTKKFVLYLYRAFVDKDTIEADHDARQKAWWMKYVGSLKDDTVICGHIDCPLIPTKPYKIYFHRANFESHVQYHQAEVKLERNVNIRNYVSFDDYLLRCKRCNILFTYYFNTRFTTHLREKHNITAPWRGGESSQKTNNDDEKTNYRIKRLLQYLIEG